MCVCVGGGGGFRGIKKMKPEKIGWKKNLWDADNMRRGGKLLGQIKDPGWI